MAYGDRFQEPDECFEQECDYDCENCDDKDCEHYIDEDEEIDEAQQREDYLEDKGNWDHDSQKGN